VILQFALYRGGDLGATRLAAPPPSAAIAVAANTGTIISAQRLQRPFDGGCWPIAEITAAGRGGGFLGWCCRGRPDAAGGIRSPRALSLTRLKL
jgi:hypothetical protein